MNRHEGGSACKRGDLYDGFDAYLTRSDEELREVLRTGLVVIDTVVLLNLYRYNPEARAAIVAVMAALGERLWIPHQVLEEFWRNRERALSDPLREVKGDVAKLNGFLESSVEVLHQWVNKAALKSTQSAGAQATLEGAYAEARGLLEGLIDQEAVQRARNTHHDPVLSILAPVLKDRVGAQLAPESYREAVAEGKRRIEAQEPPGYRDAGKKGDGATGDYLVWEQTLVEAATRNKPVVFVTGDMKSDWWRLEDRTPRGPRVELARELRSRCGQELFMISPQHLLKLADAVDVEVSQKSLEDVERTSQGGDAGRTSEIRDPIEGIEFASSGWTEEALNALLARLRYEAPVQEAAIRFAAEQGGFISRPSVYLLGEYEPSRQLKGFARPVNRIVAELKDAGELPDQAADVLNPVYKGNHGFGWVDGYRIPAEIVRLLGS